VIRAGQPSGFSPNHGERGEFGPEARGSNADEHFRPGQEEAAKERHCSGDGYRAEELRLPACEDRRHRASRRNMVPQLFRSAIRALAHAWLRANFRITVTGGEVALACRETGSIVVARHVSRLDAVLLMSEAWPYARIRPTAWHREYAHWLQYPFMKLFGVISVGSPKTYPESERRRRTAKSKELMQRVLDNNEHLMIFAEGSIGDGTTVRIPAHFTGVYDAIRSNPSKPILIVDLAGLERSRTGRGKPKFPWFSRPRIEISIDRADLPMDGGPEKLNKWIEDYFNVRGKRRSPAPRQDGQALLP
jgi:1-acyl-sn-glycerol-3-phosphate acyltransferase